MYLLHYIMLPVKEKQKIIEKHKIHETDTGSPEIQIAILTERIKELTDHLKKNPKDHSSRRGLLKIVNKRRKFLEDIRFKDEKRHKIIVKKIGLK